MTTAHPEPTTGVLDLSQNGFWERSLAGRHDAFAALRALDAPAYFNMGDNPFPTLDSAGFYALNGRQVTLQLTDPSSYTDYVQDDALVEQQLRAAGIDATFTGQSVDEWNADIAKGNFQLTLHWGQGGVTPYNLYQNWLDDSLISSSGATGDFERLKDPAIESDLAALSSARDVTAQAAALAPIAKYVAANLPVIPTTTAADWFEYNSQNYVNWPTQSNPYDSGQPSGTNNGPGTGSDEVVILHLTPAS